MKHGIVCNSYRKYMYIYSYFKTAYSHILGLEKLDSSILKCRSIIKHRRKITELSRKTRQLLQKEND